MQNLSFFIPNTVKISGPNWFAKSTGNFACIFVNVIHCITYSLCKKIYFSNPGFHIIVPIAKNSVQAIRAILFINSFIHSFNKHSLRVSYSACLPIWITNPSCGWFERSTWTCLPSCTLSSHGNKRRGFSFPRVWGRRDLICVITSSEKNE